MRREILSPSFEKVTAYSKHLQGCLQFVQSLFSRGCFFCFWVPFLLRFYRPFAVMLRALSPSSILTEVDPSAGRSLKVSPATQKCPCRTSRCQIRKKDAEELCTPHGPDDPAAGRAAWVDWVVLILLTPKKHFLVPLLFTMGLLPFSNHGNRPIVFSG